MDQSEAVELEGTFVRLERIVARFDTACENSWDLEEAHYLAHCLLEYTMPSTTDTRKQLLQDWLGIIHKRLKHQ